MKKLIFTLLLMVPILSYGQATLTLDADTNSVYVGAFEHPKNTLRAKYSDSGLSIIGTDNTTFAADRKYDTYINGATDSTFATFDALKAWVKENFFVDALGGGSGGGDSATLESVTTGTGNNLTPNAIQVNGYVNLDMTKTSTALLEQGANGGIYRIDSAAGGIVGSIEMSNTIVALNAGGVSSINIQPETGVNASVLVSGRLQAHDGINSMDVPTMSQISSFVSNLGNRSIAGLTTLGSSSIAATHTLTIPSVGTGWTHYNTVDQTTNYERVLGSWIGNVYTIATGIGGTGTARALRLNAGVGSLTIGGTSSTGILNFAASASTANISWIGLGGTLSATTGMQNGLSLFQTINQSSGAGYRCVWISPQETALGSNPKYLIDAGTNTAANGSGTHTSRFSVDNTGNTIAAKYSVSALNTAPASATDTGTTGEIRITATAIYICTATNTWVRALLTTF